MKSIFAFALMAGALWTAGPAAAQQDPYRWCAELGGGNDGGATNCYFMTLEQCQATVSGVGGFCRHNHFYTGPAPAHRRSSKKRAAH